jgi:hypothetical protein
MGRRFGIGALAVAALIAAGPASAQLTAKPAVGTTIGVQSATIAAFEPGVDGYGEPAANGWDIWTWTTFGVFTVGFTAVVLDDSSDPSSP